MYVPSPGTFTVFSSVGFPVVGSTSLAGLSLSISTVSSLLLTVVLPPVNVRVAFCVAPWTSSVPLSSPFGVTGLTNGVYLPFTGVPFLSSRWTSIPLASPVKFGSGVNVTFPFSSIS